MAVDAGKFCHKWRKKDWNDQDVVLSMNAENIMNWVYDKWGSFNMKENYKKKLAYHKVM